MKKLLATVIALCLLLLVGNCALVLVQTGGRGGAGVTINTHH
jgi:preprotein translocase subunit SecG